MVGLVLVHPPVAHGWDPRLAHGSRHRPDQDSKLPVAGGRRSFQVFRNPDKAPRKELQHPCPANGRWKMPRVKVPCPFFVWKASRTMTSGMAPPLCSLPWWTSPATRSSATAALMNIPKSLPVSPIGRVYTRTSLPPMPLGSTRWDAGQIRRVAQLTGGAASGATDMGSEPGRLTSGSVAWIIGSLDVG